MTLQRPIAAALTVSLLLATAGAWPARAGAAEVQTSVVYAIDQGRKAHPLHAFVLGRDGLLYGAVGSDMIPGKDSGGDILHMNPAGGDIQSVHVFNAVTEGVLPSSLMQASDGNFYGATLHSYRTGGAGVIFKMTPQGELTVLNRLDSDPGYISWALAPLTEGRDGDLYGATYDGGKYYCGVAFKVSKAGKYTPLHSFNPATEGCEGIGGLVLASDGNFYGTTSAQVAGTNLGAVYRMTPDGKVTVIHLFKGESDGGYPYGPLSIGRDGNLYGTALYYLSPTIFKVTPAGDFATIHTFDPITEGTPATDITVGADGNLYGLMNNSFPTNQSGTLYRLAPDGTGFTSLNTFPAALPMDPQGFGTFTDLIEASPGNFYGMAGPIPGAPGASFLYRLTVTN